MILRMEGLPPVRYPMAGQTATGVPVHNATGDLLCTATVTGEDTACVVELPDDLDLMGRGASATWDMRGSAPRIIDVVLVAPPGFPTSATGGVDLELGEADDPDLDPRGGA